MRAVGIALLFMAAVTYIQGSHILDEGRKRQDQVEALTKALVSEQQNTVNNGETPVAPDPKQILASPEVVNVKGEKGDKGDPGTPGSPGASGKPGKDGTNGLNGIDGQNATPEDPVTVTGAPGAAGEPGKDGKDGVNGKDGSPPTDITITIDGTTYVCTPVASGSTSFKCDAQDSTGTPSPSSTDEIGAQP